MIDGDSSTSATRTASETPAPADKAGCSVARESTFAMNGNTIEHKLTITNPQGFHLRPMAAFAEVANRFQSQVTVSRDDKHVNGKSPLELMFLAAEQGSELTIAVSGPDAAEAVKALVDLMANMEFEEEKIEEPPLPPKG
jgi:phosphocarrier protein HPr